MKGECYGKLYFLLTNFFAFGKDTENDAGKYVKRFGGSKVLIHYGGGSVIDSSKAIAAGITDTDIMAHLHERYLTNSKDVEVTDRLIEGLLMIHEGPRVIENPDNYEARANIMWAGMMAHNNL
ncbi:iron-containing alcohol dehydrogenase [Butyrivibrio sp. YAB3001]|uniref:iron-containing alcohol dehydrogenase n=1 Tax=Butyrivibrio sp. YAB3001 TaxID=1520812 RepID=UPI0008F669CD|nr:iron-containing alcohol dehydrogenase [Butyrivibrio sp. YAB3001]SFC65781.1 Iron-containing alcohol dehydrogenase [Butyrivibrio sp. YAB3001]